MREHEMSKRIMNYNPEGKRGDERHKSRWTDAVDNYMRRAGVINCEWKLKIELDTG
jgi:hypothetical protein